MRIAHSPSYFISPPPKAVANQQRFLRFRSPKPFLSSFHPLKQRRPATRAFTTTRRRRTSTSLATENMENGSTSISPEEDSKFGFTRPEMYKTNLAGTIGEHDRHLFLCFKNPESWLPRVEESQTDLLPKLLSSAVKSRKADFTVKVVKHIKWKLTAVSASYISQIEAVQNFVRLHRDCSGLEESLASTNAPSIEDKLQVSSEQTKEVSNYMYGFVKKLSEQSQELQNCAMRADKIQSSSRFQKAYEGHSKPVTEKLVADINNLVSNHIWCLKEMVDATLVDLRGSATEKKAILDRHVSMMDEHVSMQSENSVKDAANYSAVKHCRRESLLQRCLSTIKSALVHCKMSK